LGPSSASSPMPSPLDLLIAIVPIVGQEATAATSRDPD
jgi:hypothetical protein